ncbi:hypothetical protein Tco_1230793, partial [Tanacetum coccineum]
SQEVLVDIPERITEHGLSSKITQSSGGSSDMSEGSENSRSFEDYGSLGNRDITIRIIVLKNNHLQDEEREVDEERRVEMVLTCQEDVTISAREEMKELLLSEDMNSDMNAWRNMYRVKIVDNMGKPDFIEHPEQVLAAHPDDLQSPFVGHFHQPLIPAQEFPLVVPAKYMISECIETNLSIEFLSTAICT